MKRCTNCKLDKELSEFGSDSQKKDGISSYCRPCSRIKNKENRVKNPDYYKNYYRKYNSSNCEQIKEKSRKFFRKFKEKIVARRVANKAVRDGVIERKSHCEDCYVHCKTEAYHKNYSKKLEVIWLCRTCNVNKKKNKNI